MTYCINVCVYIAVDCGYPDPADPNGERKGPDATTLGNTATYTCNHGYLPPDPVTIKCLYTGLWSGGAPVCYRKNTSFATHL